MNRCADVLADRLEQEARALADEASALTTAEWQTQVPRHGDEIAVIVDHVASAYLQLTQTITGGEPVACEMGDAVNDLLRNSSAAAEAIRSLSDEELDRVNLC